VGRIVPTCEQQSRDNTPT